MPNTALPSRLHAIHAISESVPLFSLMRDFPKMREEREGVKANPLSIYTGDAPLREPVIKRTVEGLALGGLRDEAGWV